MTRVFVPNDPVKERKRFAYDHARAKQELSSIGNSYEAKASLVVGGELVQRQMHDGSQASPQQMQRLSGSAYRG
jgi:hypothetical protein